MYLSNSKIIVVKIGSSLLVDKNQKIRKKWLSNFAKDIQRLKSKNQKILHVTATRKILTFIKRDVCIELARFRTHESRFRFKITIFADFESNFELKQPNQDSKGVNPESKITKNFELGQLYMRSVAFAFLKPVLFQRPSRAPSRIARGWQAWPGAS